MTNKLRRLVCAMSVICPASCNWYACAKFFEVSGAENCDECNDMYRSYDYEDLDIEPPMFNADRPVYYAMHTSGDPIFLYYFETEKVSGAWRVGPQWDEDNEYLLSESGDGDEYGVCPGAARHWKEWSGYSWNENVNIELQVQYPTPRPTPMPTPEPTPEPTNVFEGALEDLEDLPTPMQIALGVVVLLCCCGGIGFCIFKASQPKSSREVPLHDTERPCPHLDPLPVGWEEVIDPNTGKVYYQNHRLKKTQWEKPTV